MPNYVVFNREPEQLKTQIYGSDANTPISTTDGRLNIESISADVTVTANDLDIRDLVFGTDAIRVYGSESTPLSTTGGRLNIESISADVNTILSARTMVSETETDVTSSTTVDAGLLASDRSRLSEASFAVHNKTANQVSIRIEVSPSNTGPWMIDTLAETLNGNEATVFVPRYFLSYARIAYASLTDAVAITFDAWYQAQA
jgi:hypothetical protein